jgi:hypothetical protein
MEVGMMLRMRVLSLALCLGLFLLAPRPLPVLAQQPELPDVLALAAKYVSVFADPTHVLYCEERYKHTFQKLIVNAQGSAERLPQGGHNFVAELAVVATPSDEKNGLPWLEFRDIVSLDGKPERDGKSRLGTLLAQPIALAGPEALRITRETSSTQSGRFDRALLLPRLACIFLHAVNQPRFVFRKGGDRTIQDVKTWEVKFQEKGVPTIISATTGRDAPSTGSFWIDPATGHVLASMLKNGDSSALFDELSVMYAHDPTTDLWLPTTMSDKTTDIEESRELEGTGTFKNWRIAPRTAK